MANSFKNVKFGHMATLFMTTQGRVNASLKRWFHLRRRFLSHDLKHRYHIQILKNHLPKKRKDKNVISLEHKKNSS